MRPRRNSSLEETTVSMDTKSLVESRAQDHGLILRALGDTCAFCPPLIITEAEIDELFDRFERALSDTEAWVEKNGLRN